MLIVPCAGVQECQYKAGKGAAPGVCAQDLFLSAVGWCATSLSPSRVSNQLVSFFAHMCRITHPRHHSNKHRAQSHVWQLNHCGFNFISVQRGFSPFNPLSLIDQPTLFPSNVQPLYLNPKSYRTMSPIDDLLHACECSFGYNTSLPCICR